MPPTPTPQHPTEPGLSDGRGRIPRVLAGLLLLAAGVVPLALHLLDPDRTGPAGAATRAAVRALADPLRMGTAIVFGVALVAAFLPGLDRPFRRLGALAGRVLDAGTDRRWALGCGTAAFVAAALAGHLLFLGEPTLVDEMAQLADARALAGMQPPAEAPGAAIRMQNGYLTDGRWVSVYPPGQTLLLAAALRFGVRIWLGPLLWGLAVGLASATFLRLSLGAPRVGRAAGLLLAASPMGWLIGGGALSHTGAAAAVALALFATVRAEGLATGPAPASPARLLPGGLLLGAAAGWAVSTRPLTGLALAVVLPAGWLLVRAGRRGIPVLAGAVAGGLPFAVGLGLWNRARTGDPLRFGYEAAFGPAHGLGFGTDPWGNAYGVVEALGYTAAELHLLGGTLLETPFSLVALVGVGLVIARGSTPGVRLALGWIGAALAANALYWHHGLHFGPRMLFETLPAWTFLVAATGLGLLRTTAGTRTGRAVRAGFLTALALTLVVNLPARIGSAAVGAQLRAQLPATEAVLALPDSAVVFVHGSWASRVAGRLAQGGMRADSIETALRRNDLCALHEASVAGLGRGSASTLGRIDFDPRPGTPANLRVVEVAPGIRIRLESGRRLEGECLREAWSDRFGGLELEAVRWRTLRPDVTWLRDLGPAWNPAIGGARVLAPEGAGERPVFSDYAAGMRRLWGATGEAPDGRPGSDSPELSSR